MEKGEKSNLFDQCKFNQCNEGPLVTDENTGEVVCGTCGLVLIEKPEDPGRERHAYNSEQYFDRARTGAGSTLAIDDMGLSTVINPADRDASGNSLSSNMRETFNRLRVWDTRSKSKSRDRNLRTAFTILNTLKTKLAIPDIVVENTAYIYRKAISKRLTSGRSVPSVIAAALYAACRQANTPRSINDIAKAANLRRKDLSRTYRILIKSLDLRMNPYNPISFLNRISTEIEVGEKTKRDALTILDKAHEKEVVTGKNPLALAAAALNLACIANMEKKTQTKISKASAISSVTIRNRSDTLRRQLDIESMLAKRLIN